MAATDILIRSFFSNTNYTFYNVYPLSFLDEYQEWWDSVSQGQPIGLPWTCLFLTLCACAVQDADPTLKEAIELDTRENVFTLSERYHNLAREIWSIIPPGYYHIYTCQWLLHSAYWFVSRGKYLESWHVLSAAAREGWDLGKEQTSIRPCVFHIC